MSILIKGMEMPTSCARCRMWACCPALPEEEWPDYESILLNDVIGDGGTRDSDCPLVPIPPHGRLIDADSAMECIKSCRAFRGDYLIILEDIFDGESTIIEAEE